MKIIVDAFGGDNAPAEAIKGAAMAVEEMKCEVLLVGDEKKIKDCAAENGVSLQGISVKQADAVFEMEFSPRSILRENKNTSLAVGLQALADGEGDAFVSAGSTGAFVLGASYLVRRLEGVKRAAIASILPTSADPVMLLDCGANIECNPEDLELFAFMGSIYMNKVLGKNSPRIGLANIGVEENKGTQLLRDSYQLLKNNKKLGFAGNAEVRDIPAGGFDVVVADGFTGNVILKMYEGVSGELLSNIKGIFKTNLLTKLAAAAIMPQLKVFKKKMDYTEYGGAVLLGISKPVIKAHGSSNAKAFKNAVRQACNIASNGVIDEIAANIKNLE